MGVRVFADGFVFLIVVTPPAVHWVSFGVLRVITVMTAGTLQVVTLFGRMGEMIENHGAAVGSELKRFRGFRFHEILRIMTEITLHGALRMTGHAIFTDAPFVNRFIGARVLELAGVMALPAVPGVLVLVMMAFPACGVLERCVHLVIENNAAACRIERNTDRFFLFLQRITQDGDDDKHHGHHTQGQLFFVFRKISTFFHSNSHYSFFTQLYIVGVTNISHARPCPADMFDTADNKKT